MINNEQQKALVEVCKMANELLQIYQVKADNHWNNIGRFVRNDRYGRREFEFRDDNGTPDPTRAAAETQQLIKFLDYPFWPAEFKLDLPSKTATRAQREMHVLAMYLSAARWLCSFFHGVPRHDIWDEVVALSRKLGTFPGEAFFNKLVGDIYRSERRKQSRPRVSLPLCDYSGTTPPKGPEMPGIMVMAFSPLIFLDDKHDLLEFPRKIELDDIEPSTQIALTNLVRYVDSLSSRYLRYQMWRYIFDTKNPLFYGVGHWSLQQKTETLAGEIVNVLAATHDEYKEDMEKYLLGLNGHVRNQILDEQIARYIDSRTELQRPRRLTATQQDNYESALKRIREDSDKRIIKFLTPRDGTRPEYNPQTLPNRRIIIFFDDDKQGKGLTSCTLGAEEGVLASPPKRTGDWAHSCFWQEGLPVAVERKKLRDLWEDVKVPGLRGDTWLEFPPADQWKNNNPDFASQWSNWRRLNSGSVVDNLKLDS